ncbi:MAG: glycine betaine ABC transporter substrate-binding protein [Nocardioides sp.]|uniref:glycine betaine ABC transporter substrate-binding protein n=1 Tax=Nocardioides sp. TaxID=35761 RepID=UPI0039E6C504
MKPLKRLKLTAALVAVALVGATACASGNSETGSDSGGDDSGGGSGQKITIGYINWDEDVSASYLWQRILDDKGYDVELKQVSDAGPLYVGLAKGQVDTYVAAWLPTTHAAYWKKYGDQLTDISTWYDSAPLTIAVPTYLKDINSIADLKDNADEFDSTITGIEPGAGETGIVQKLIQTYGLDGWTLKTSSTSAMLAALKKAVDSKDPIVVDLWRPHWAYSAYPIKDLKDPKGALGDPDQIHIVGTGSFASDFPEVTKMMKKFHMTDDQLNSLEQEVRVEHKSDPETGVDEWLKDNPDFVKTLS